MAEEPAPQGPALLAMELICSGGGKSSHASGVATRAVSLPALFDFRTPVLAGQAGSGLRRWVCK